MGSSSFIQTTIGETCYVTDGAHSKVERQTKGILYLTSKNIGVGRLILDNVDHISRADYERLFSNTAKAQRRPQNGDIITGIIGTFGNAYRYKASDEFGVSSAVALIRPDQSILAPDFLYYVITSPYFKAVHASYKSGSVQGYTNIPTIKQLPFTLPPLPEQQAIVHILGTLDDKIELNRQMNATLEAMAQALFKSWFVDFDPVIDNALAAGNPIPEPLQPRAEARAALGDQRKPLPTHRDVLVSREAGCRERPEAIQKQFPNRFVFNEEMGWVPEGWEIENLSERVDVLNGFAFKSKDYTPEGIFVLRTKNFDATAVVELLPDDVYLPDSFTVSHEKYLCEEFDYHLIMVGASVGNRGLILPHHLPALRNQNMWCFRPIKDSGISKAFVKYMLDTLIVEKMGLASGSAREFFRKGDFQNHKIVIGNKSIQTVFSQMAFPLLQKQATNGSQAERLANIRDTLLPKLLSGQLRIPDAEQQLAEAL